MWGVSFRALAVLVDGLPRYTDEKTGEKKVMPTDNDLQEMGMGFG